MSVILILIAFSLLIAGSFLIGFLWSVKTGQYDDDVSPAVRILLKTKCLPQTNNLILKIQILYDD
ncbi:MAG: cbb3-type cytochrome oxidase assembly protein CcoS [Bacteroidetes bacterium]|nr:cbb3-type cytochrome oxidase assembly protein CcoS [Bacteroidota bacterium]